MPPDETARELHVPRIRIYLLSEVRPPAGAVSEALPDYEVVLARSPREMALIRKLAVDSEAAYREECERVARILALQLPTDSYLGCCYDDEHGRTRYPIEYRKTGDDKAFVPNEPETPGE
jgi:hypothetical protein